MALQLGGITKHFGAQVALDAVSLRVEDGDCYGLIGHNGAGKTTVMRIALGLQRADRGQIVVDGFDALRFPREARARLGALIETPGFQGGWSGQRNLLELARLAGFSRRDAAREAGRWIERVGLGHAGPKNVQNYSHGMRQRLGIACALLGSPRYVLLDEPTNGLDPEGIAEMRELIGSLRREGGLSFLVSSHQLHELGAICNRVGILRGGKMLAEDELTKLVHAGGERWQLETAKLAEARVVARELGVRELPSSAPNVLSIDLAGVRSAAVTRALFERGVDVVSFAPSSVGLEEIYLRFAHEGAGGATPAPVPALPVIPEPEERLAPPAPIARMTAFDLRRFARSAGLVLLLLSPVVLAIVACVRRGLASRSEEGAVRGSELFSATGANAFEALGLALQAGVPALLFIVLGLSSQSIAAEYGRGTLRNVLLRPLRRLECALGKWAALIVTTSVAYIALAAASFGIAGLLFDFGDVAEVLPNGQRFTLTPAADLWPLTWSALVSPLAPLFAYTSIGFLAGAIARTGAVALALAIGGGVMLDLARALAREFARGGYLPSDHISSPLSDTSYLRFFVDSAQGVSNATLEYSSTAVWVPVAWGLVCFVIAAHILNRRAIP